MFFPSNIKLLKQIYILWIFLKSVVCAVKQGRLDGNTPSEMLNSGFQTIHCGDVCTYNIIMYHQI